jgi:replication fork clamp-binding protein CrfC
MIFPDGTKQEGQFENNTYKVRIEISSEAQAQEMEKKIGEFRQSVSPRLASEPHSISS